MTDIAPDETTPDRAETRRVLSGLEYLRKLLTGEMPPAGMVKLLNLKLIEVSEGYAVLTVQPDERHYNGLGIAHGGLAATLLDTATGCAINAMMPAGKVFTTLEMKVNYLRPITADCGVIRCEGTVIHAGGRIATAEGRIVDENGKLYAHGTATCMLFRLRE
jgi:uncharacterized protein (TIGR00369 family)